MAVVHRGIDVIHDADAFPAGGGPIAPLIRDLLTHLGEDPTRAGLQKTPERVEKAMRFLTQGYEQRIEDIVNGAIFEEPGAEMIVVKDIEFYSMCEHHMLPFFGRAHVGYISDGRIIGLSKIPRLVDVFARRLQVQERMTTQVAGAVNDAVRPRGVGVILEAHHFCMMMRGVEKQDSVTTTSCMLGAFCDDDKTRAEFLGLLR